MKDHIHTPQDGRGRRDVLVNGRQIARCVFADTRKGKVRHYDDPPRMHKHKKRAIVRTLRGKVEVIARAD